MCYTNIKKVDQPDQKYFYKVVKDPKEWKGEIKLWTGMNPINTKYYSFFTCIPLYLNRWLKSKYVGLNESTGHSKESNKSFKGFSCFHTYEEACNWLYNTGCYIIKIKARGNPRKAIDNFKKIECLLFDEIYIKTQKEII